MSTLIVGCGYLGRRVGLLLARRGEHVFGTTRTESKLKELQGFGIEPIVADVLNPETLANLPATDRVLYCVGFDRAAGIPMRTVYLDGLRNALARLANRNVMIVYASSTGVYGQEDGAWVVEDSPTIPRHESGQIVLAAEQIVRASEGPRVILRFSGMYGPGRIPRRENIVRGLPIPGDPHKYLNLIHIDDASAAAVAAFDRAKSGDLYLISDDRPIERREYATEIARCLGAPDPRFAPPAPNSPEARREEGNKRVSNRQMKDGLGVSLSFPDISTGIPAVFRAEATGVGTA